MTSYLSPRERHIRELLDKAHANLRRREPLRAQMRLQHVLKLDADRYDALLMLGVLSARDGALVEALAHLQRASGLRPDDPHVHNNLGNVLSALQRHALALLHYDTALKLEPGHSAARSNRQALLSSVSAAQPGLPLQPSDPVAPRLPQPPAAAHHAPDAPDPTAVPPPTAEELADALNHALNAPWHANEPQHTVFGEPAELPAKAPQAQDHRPALLAAALNQAGLRPGATVLDLACGAGHCGAGLRGLAAHLVGVDSYPGWIIQATDTGRYDDLVTEAPLAYLRSLDRAFDAMACATLLAAPMDAAELLDAVWQALRPGGMLAFVVDDPMATDAAQATPWQPEALARGRGFVLALSGDGLLHHEPGRPVHGRVTVLRRPAA